MAFSQTAGAEPGQPCIPAGVVQALMGSLELPELLETVLANIAGVLAPADIGLVLLRDPSDGLLRARAVYGRDGCDRLAAGRLALEESEAVTGGAYADGVIRLLDAAEVTGLMTKLGPANRAVLSRAFGLAAPPASLLIAPLRTGEHNYGLLFLGTRPGSAGFAPADLTLLRAVADLIALAVDRAWREAEAESLREAQQVDRLRAEALAILSHEMRTPLAAIKGYSTALLLEGFTWPPEKQQEFLHLIDESCETLQSMLAQILDSALIDIGQLALEYQPVRLERLTDEVVAELQRRTHLHRLVVDFPPGFPIVDGDPLRLKQTLRNLIDNAIKYSPEGGLVVIRGEARPAIVVISVADQGVGISPEDLIPLFEKYFRVKGAAGYHVPGTGLGLPVARAIVEAHGGRIWARSRVGEGTTFYFSIPRQGLSALAAEGEPV